MHSEHACADDKLCDSHLRGANICVGATGIKSDSVVVNVTGESDAPLTVSFPEFDDLFIEVGPETAEPVGNELTFPDPHPVFGKDNSPDGVSCISIGVTSVSSCPFGDITVNFPEFDDMFIETVTIEPPIMVYLPDRP